MHHWKAGIRSNSKFVFNCYKIDLNYNNKVILNSNWKRKKRIKKHSINLTAFISLFKRKSVTKSSHALSFILISFPIHGRVFFPLCHCNLLFMAIRNLAVSQLNLHLVFFFLSASASTIQKKNSNSSRKIFRIHYFKSFLHNSIARLNYLRFFSSSLSHFSGFSIDLPRRGSESHYSISFKCFLEK